LRKYGARIDDWKTPLDSAYRVLMSIESGSLFAEKLLTKRYGLLSDIWDQAAAAEQIPRGGFASRSGRG